MKFFEQILLRIVEIAYGLMPNITPSELGDRTALFTIQVRLSLMYISYTCPRLFLIDNHAFCRTHTEILMRQKIFQFLQ